MAKKAGKSKQSAKAHPRKSSTSFFPTLKKDERYAGILLDPKGKPTAHLILLPGELTSGTWSAAGAWAKKSGGELPTRQEQALLFANAKGEFQSAWYWSCEEYAPDPGSAWTQFFSNGLQTAYHEDFSYRARAVRRVPIR